MPKASADLSNDLHTFSNLQVTILLNRNLLEQTLLSKDRIILDTKMALVKSISQFAKIVEDTAADENVRVEAIIFEVPS